MIHPDDTFTIFLDRLPDDSPAADRPALVFRVGAASSWRGYEAGIDAIMTAPDKSRDEIVESLAQVIESRMADHRNIGLPLIDHMAEPMIINIASTLQRRQRLTESDLKNFGSPSPLVAAASAPSAAGGPADA